MTTDATPATLPKPIIKLSCVFGLSWKNITIYCETLKDAEEVFDWLCEGPALTAQIEALTAERDSLREALAETREMLGLCEQIICDETCPTTWRTADGQPHGQMHKDICDVLARHEHHIHPARSALTASEAPDA